MLSLERVDADADRRASVLTKQSREGLSPSISGRRLPPATCLSRILSKTPFHVMLVHRNFSSSAFSITLQNFRKTGVVCVMNRMLVRRLVQNTRLLSQNVFDRR